MYSKHTKMSEPQQETFTKFVELNSGFIITFFGMIGACVSGTLVYFLRSRCTRVKCFCLECIRQPISEENMSRASLEHV